MTVQVPFNAEAASTEALIKGLYDGFRFTLYEYDAAFELVKRGEIAALRTAAETTTFKGAKSAIRRALKEGKVQDA